MVTQSQPQSVTIEVEVLPAERDAATAVASGLGMNVEDALKIMLRRFVAEKGLPFPMRAPANDIASAPPTATPHGVSLARLSVIAAQAGKDAAARHAAAGRVSALPAEDLSAARPAGLAR